MESGGGYENKKKRNTVHFEVATSSIENQPLNVAAAFFYESWWCFFYLTKNKHICQKVRTNSEQT